MFKKFLVPNLFNRPHPPAQIKVTEGPLIKLVLKVNWLGPLGFEGELGNGVEREEFTVDGVSHGSCQG